MLGKKLEVLFSGRGDEVHQDPQGGRHRVPSRPKTMDFVICSSLSVCPPPSINPSRSWEPADASSSHFTVFTRDYKPSSVVDDPLDTPLSASSPTSWKWKDVPLPALMDRASLQTWSFCSVLCHLIRPIGIWLKFCVSLDFQKSVQ